MKKINLGLAGFLVLLLLICQLYTNREQKTLAKNVDLSSQKALVEKGILDTSEDAKETTEESPVEAEETIAPGQYPIMGKSAVTLDQMVSFFKENEETYPTEILGKGGADSIETFCQIYYEEATAEGVRPEVAFVQTMKETGWLQYGGDAKIEQYNFSGLGTTGGGVQGNAFADVRTGVRAQIQHLKAYATDAPLNQECVDSRYDYVKKGCSPYVEWLGQQENPSGTGWATAPQYGESIVSMIQNLKN